MKHPQTERQLFNLLNYDLLKFFCDDVAECESEETPATIMIAYQRDLQQKEFNFFDQVQFRILYDKEVIVGVNPINVVFKSKSCGFDINVVKEMVVKIAAIYGTDDSRVINDPELKNFAKGGCRIFWTIGDGDSFISIENRENEGLMFSILFFNNLLSDNDLQIMMSRKSCTI
ncbi:MAG: hypothetical protein MJ069_05375 [Salinivirgaceae bacterium]|nr:hypothetical protein [Salinivirgaceae bacterium]